MGVRTIVCPVSANHVLSFTTVLPRLVLVPTHVDGVLVSLEHRPEHLTGLETGLVDEVVSNTQQLRESHLDDLVEIGSCLSHLEPVHPADGQQALQTSEDRAGILGVQEIDRDVEKVGPLLGEVVVENLLERCNELCSDLRR